MQRFENRLLRRVTLVSAVCAGVMIVALMCLTVVDVILRAAGGGGVPGGIEWTEVVLVIAVYFGMMTAEYDDAHVRTPLLTDRMKPVVAQALRLVGTLAISVLVVWMIIVTAEAALRAFSVGEVHPGISRVPVWPAKIIIPIGLLGMLVVFIAHSIQRVLNIRELVRLRAADSTAVEESR